MKAPEDDERFSWNAALAIMLLISGATIVLRLLGLFPFQDIFAISLVGIPTVLLLIGRYGMNRRRE